MGDDERLRSATRPAVPSARARAGERPHVLVVDDEDVFRTMVVALLRPHFEVSVAEHGGVALRLLETERASDIAAIISDVRMPWVNGIDLHRTLASRGHPLARHFVWMSGGGLSEAHSRYVEASGLALLDKPFSAEDLRSAIARVGLPVRVCEAG